MPLKTIVKVSNMSNLSDARYCAGMGVEMLGFSVIPGTDDYITPEVFQDIRGWISGPRIVAELYGLSDPGQIATVIQAYAPDYFELSVEEYSHYKEFLNLPSLVYVSGVAGTESLKHHKDILYLLMDEHASCADIAGTGLPALKKITSVNALRKSLDEGCFEGIAFRAPKGAPRPGVANYEQLGSILEALEEE